MATKQTAHETALAPMTMDRAQADIKAKLKAKGMLPEIISAALLAFQKILSDFCIQPAPAGKELAVLVKAGKAAFDADDMTPERRRLRWTLWQAGVPIRRGQLNEAERMSWEAAAETPPETIDQYAAVWAAEPQ